MEMKNIMIYIKYILRFYIIYAALFGVLIFGIYRPKDSGYLNNHSVDRFFLERVHLKIG